ncbi:accessory Sec system translocase SecA2 [uncultured Acetatifactor sp.]|jgi:preprotein translocase subunit SecA|uniref:accessory Sec system translocase SecA2 n=1 Tax=uncultured Acetatifactor sp. TaxID=1671927 RepID=UPI002630DF8F|nr:accessory Sec system translocase SecA2 [uncultured Acetatifactor sp.]
MANKKLYRILKKVKREQFAARALSDDALGRKTEEFRGRIAEGASTNSLLPEAFAVACEADRRILGKEPYDCQILGGIALHYGYLAEMNTGEGKTLTATLPLYLNALTGKSTMLVTANDYLADRDAEELRPVYEFLGMSVRSGVSRDQEKDMHNDEKRQIYQADIVYTTHSLLGFDYLLNNLVSSAEDRFMREFYYVIIDEADMVLMDAATMPLVISGVPRVQSNLYAMADFFVTTLEPERDYIEEEHAVWLTDEGVAYAERYFRIEKFYAAENFELNRHVTLALKAHITMERDKDYVVTEKGEVSLLDNGTGRLLPGMKLRGGVHQAIESKEKVKITQENRSVASITYQNLFLLFPRMSGMSGTIADAKKELYKVYKKRVAIIPPNRPLQRVDKKDLFFKNAEAQYEEAIQEVLRCHETGQPVLIVTSTIADTELASRLLIAEQVAHSVLNANNAYWEAQIIKEAGQEGTITVSTGMAGRGTDIRLGPGVKELGGLAVIGIGRMANIRLERQARGRAGRQGDPGSSQFFVSLEDDTVSAVGEKTLEKYVDRDCRISRRKLRKLINGTRKLREEQAVAQRKRSVDYDKVLKRQRTMMYEVRNRLLDGGSLEPEMVKQLAYEGVQGFLKENPHPATGDVTRYVLNNIAYNLDNRFLNIEQMKGRAVKKVLGKVLISYINTAWKNKARSFASEEELKEYIRLCSLRAIDDAWVEQVDYLQQLQYVVSGRATAQRNPVFEYHEEAYDSFLRMEKTIKREIVRNIFLGDKKYNKAGEMFVLFP